MKTIILSLILLGQSLAHAGTSGPVPPTPDCHHVITVSVSAGEHEAVTGVDFKTHFTEEAIELYSSGVEISKGKKISLDDLKRFEILSYTVLDNCPGEAEKDVFIRIKEGGGSLLKKGIADKRLVGARTVIGEDFVHYIADEVNVTRDFSNFTKTELALANKGTRGQVTLQTLDFILEE